MSARSLLEEPSVVVKALERPATSASSDSRGSRGSRRRRRRPDGDTPGTPGTPVRGVEKRVEKRVSKWNPKLQLWEHRDMSLPRGSRLLNARDTYHSNNISALFSDPSTPGRSTKTTTMAVSRDLAKMGLMSELSAKTLQALSIDPRMRHPRQFSNLTRFAEHAVAQGLKPFAVGRG